MEKQVSGEEGKAVSLSFLSLSLEAEEAAAAVAERRRWSGNTSLRL